MAGNSTGKWLDMMCKDGCCLAECTVHHVHNMLMVQGKKVDSFMFSCKINCLYQSLYGKYAIILLTSALPSSASVEQLAK